jgi:hypothetical protein
MELRKGIVLRVLGACAALIALSVVVAGGAASGSSSKANSATTITIEGKTHRALRFVAPESIEAGEKLEIENLTKPRKVGPHTFSLLERPALPKGLDEKRKCAKLGGICGDIAEAHKVDPQAGTVGKPNVDAGKKGWDASFSGNSKGDTWFTAKRKESREVTAEPGENLFFLCVVHPQMQGKLEVEG